MIRILSAVSAVIFGISAAHAASVNVVSYDVINGYRGGFDYFDDTYDGTGDNTLPARQLRGGTGDLTDGVIAQTGWRAAESPAGPGPYVGWLRPFIDIQFNFGTDVELASMTGWYDDSEGDGGVDHIRAVDVTDLGRFLYDDPAGSTFASLTIDLTGVNRSTVDIRLWGSNPWIFVSEVEFESVDAAPVPVPAAAFLLAPAIPLLMRRRKKA